MKLRVTWMSKYGITQRFDYGTIPGNQTNAKKEPRFYFGYQEAIEDITMKTGAGMEKFICKELHTVDNVKDYDDYCHYVAGLVGIGLSKLFHDSGKKDMFPDPLSNSTGLFLQIKLRMPDLCLIIALIHVSKHETYDTTWWLLQQQPSRVEMENYPDNHVQEPSRNTLWDTKLSRESGMFEVCLTHLD
ncbi:squalene synthase [Artemisia annua]|uniref:Squalene synthase n=1 Tax=Artemisia annua TaxID=35608 RepID=A0A2U1P1K0_ARTAN|nr:squalene synthase [Artemisia annua]